MTKRIPDYTQADHCEKQYLAAFKRGDREAMRYWARREYHALRITELDYELEAIAKAG